jgi:threonine dehydrogenase-like Zn-dependent dehydrogenase
MKGRVAALVGPKEVVMKEFELPKPAPGELIAEVVRANVCGSEIHIWKGLHPLIQKAVLGHEMVGKIYELGEGVTTDYAGVPVEIGDRIVAPYYITCQKCTSCLRGDFNLCKNAYMFWSKEPEEYPHFFGAFATHYYIHAKQYFYKVPDSIPSEVIAGANCALSQMIFGIDRAGLRSGETFLIQGAGGLGLNAAAVAKELGATVIVIDAVEERLQAAKEFGADFTINIQDYPTKEERIKAVNDLTGGEGADVGMEVAGVPDAFSEGIELIRPAGRYVVVGNVSPSLKTEFSPGLLVRKNIVIIPVVRYNPWYLHKAIKFLERNHEKLPYAQLTDKEYSLDEVNEALLNSEKRTVTRAVIIP